MVAAPQDVRVLLVSARRRLCGIPVADVGETMRVLPVEPIANAPVFVRGLSMIRGVPIPVVDLGALLGISEDVAPTRLVTVRVGDARMVAIAVDAVIGVRAIARDVLHALPPLVANDGTGVVDTLASLDRGLLLVLRAARLAPDEWYPA